MSASTSCNEALEALRAGREVPAELIRDLGENHPAEFFRLVVEPLNDSFEPVQIAAYERLMAPWARPGDQLPPEIPRRVDTVYVLSRVTLGADIKITSILLDGMKRRFPEAEIVFVANRKSADLFAADPAIQPLLADYPRSGPVSGRIAFAHDLARRLDTPNRIVVDPDSRMTQLGLVPVCEPVRAFHFPSRTAATAGNLTDLTRHWLEATFGVSGRSYIAPAPVVLHDVPPRTTVSLGVGGNDSKRISADFEASLVRDLASRFPTIWMDRGAGGEEALRVTAAVEASGGGAQVCFWEGSFAGFASVIAQSQFYAGYDSAGQHAAEACGIPHAVYFAGAPSPRFQERWETNAARRQRESATVTAGSFRPTIGI